MIDKYGDQEGDRSGTSTADTLLNDERVWLGVALFAGGIVVASYYHSHPYPSYATALFVHMAEVLLENGYQRPEMVPLYTEDGVPFAYPPLLFYGMAVLIDLGVDPFQLIRLLPGIAFVLGLIPYFYLAREFLPIQQAGFATVMIGVIPEAIRWHISGGGTVRGPAFLFLASGLYVGVRLFKTGDRKWVLASAVLYGLTMLTHPVYMAYFGISYLVFFLAFSCSLRGLLDAAVVAAGGAVIGMPWWLYVSRRYGFETILNASNTHGGLGSSVEGLLDSVLLFDSSSHPLEMLIGVLVLVGAIYALSNRRNVLPAWFVVTVVLIPQLRFGYLPGAMLIGLVVAGAVVPWLADIASKRAMQGASTRVFSERTSDGSYREPVATITAVVLVALIITTTWFGALYVSGDPPGEDRNVMPAFVDSDDIEAMEWVASETPSDAQFVVLGDAAEWFPYVAERTALTVWWGVEWTTPKQYEHQRALHDDLSTCDDETCVSEIIAENNLDPDYVYIPKGQFTTEATVQTQDRAMRESMIESDRYELVYENDGVIVFRVADS